jgi:hypothetical protein
MMRATTLILLLAASPALAETTCKDEGRMTHCWDTLTGRTISTTEHNPGSSYSHTWTPDGRAWTTEQREGTSHTWRTR